MSEHNGHHEAPGPDTFSVRGQTFELFVLDTYYEFEDIARTHAEAGGTHRDVLVAVSALVQDRHGIELTLGEADWLFDELGALVAKKKRARAEAIAGVLMSPSSTG